jgi:uridine phosphorylase
MKPGGNRHIAPAEALRKRLRADPPPRWKIALLCFRPYPHSQPIIDALDALPYGATVLSMEESAAMPRVYQATVHGVEVVILRGQIWGGPQTAILVEELAAVGVETVVGQGVAGSIDEAIGVGDQVVGARALPTDGTSASYLTDGAAVPADAILAESVAGAAGRLGIAVKSAAVVTVDAFYQETDDRVARWQAQGGQIINMETTPLYAAARYCRLRAVWFGYVSDSVDGPPGSQYGPEVRTRSDGICLELLREIAARRRPG